MLAHLLLPLLGLTLTVAQNSSAGLEVGPVDFGGYNDYIYRDNVTAAQIVVTDTSSSSPSRFVTAFPNGNTGALVYFVPQNNQTVGTTLDFSSVKSTSGAYNQTGITGNLSLSNDVDFGVTLIGSVRTLRDYVESGGTVFHTIFNYTLGSYTNTSVELVRNWINGSTVQYFTFEASNGVFTVSQSDNKTIAPNITLSRVNTTANITLQFTSTFNFTTTTPATPYVPLEGLGASQLFGAKANSTNISTSVLSAIQNASVVNQLAFLGYTEKFLAGGWRFLTYFGRDTMLSLKLLDSVLSTTSTEAILAAVLERANITNGQLCHEETIGDYASFINMENGQAYLGNEPSYSYVMLDTDFLLLPVLSDYLLTAGSNATTFLNTQSSLVNGTFRDLLLLNVNNVLNLSTPFAQNPTVANLVPIRSYPVGDWRDSNTGLGYGVYPFDVECALIPAALRAIGNLASAGLLPSNYTNASTYAGVWETEAWPLFKVSIDPSTASSRLNNYVTQANLSQALLYSAGSLNNSQTVTTNTSAAWGVDVIGSSGGNGNGTNSTFFALSLNPDGTPVEVLHSDLSFLMLYGNNVSSTVMEAVVEALQPYPRGLLTNVGMVVANAAYDANTTNIQVFNNLQYQGAVSWSFQQGMMAAGLSRQLGLCGLSPTTQVTTPSGSTPTWCNNTALTTALTQAQTRLWDSIAGSESVLYTEVWSPVFANGTFTIGDLGAISPEGTEGDAFQLWSYGFLAQVDPRTGKPVAAGF